jgi:dihydrofolate synthase/folylpolyglutamate synthase
MVKDKEITKVLSLLPRDAQYYFCNAHIERALPYAELRDQANHLGLVGEGYDDVNVAINTAKRIAGEDDLIIVCGSVFLVAEVDTDLLRVI